MHIRRVDSQVHQDEGNSSRPVSLPPAGTNAAH